MKPLTDAYAWAPNTSITVVGNNELYPRLDISGC
jgi:hypothetical protein